jgi:2-C-methyl-D-erythritol 2,4-cyclodiphosphate synthase
VSCHTTGIGFDSHAFGSEGTLKLGGIEFPGTPALTGHSDGDALIHAVIDALLGAACMGDIGEHFPDTSPEWKGAASGLMLQAVAAKLRATGVRPAHVDVTIVADRPRLSAVRDQMRTSLSRLLIISPESVSVKAKTQEGLSWFGATGGVAVWAVATVTSSAAE